MFVLGSAYLDPDKQLLTIGARSVTLQRKPYQVLLWLVENRHRMVYREELLERFWDGKEVYDQSLSKAIGSIRKALGEEQGSGVYRDSLGAWLSLCGSIPGVAVEFGPGRSAAKLTLT